MHKQQLINNINQILQNTKIDKGELQYTNRTKKEFIRLYGIACDLRDIEMKHDSLAKDFTLFQIMNAIMDGTNNPIMKQILFYREQINDMIEDLILG